ncbi:MAG: hypothetical protein IJS01_06905 [Lentisphaeria bacterium]|nr:hypothetical protein [Lentisphaeria bacterium]
MTKYVFFLLFFALSFPLLNGMTEEEKKDFWYKGPHLKLHHKKNRGVRPEKVMARAKNKVPNPRPAAIARFVNGGKVDKSCAVAFERVPVMLKEEAGIDRQAWVRFGLPLPKGAVYQTRFIRIVDEAGKKIPAQTSVTGFWKDDSIRWALVQFSVPLKAGEEKRCFAEFGSKAAAAEVPGVLSYKETADRITVDTGKITALIDKKKFNLIRSIKKNGVRIGGFSPAGVVLTDALSKRDYSISAQPPSKIEISESGPLRLTVRASGSYARGGKKLMDYVARVTFFAGSDAVEIDFTHINTELAREFTDLDRLDVEFVPVRPAESLRVPVVKGKELVSAKRVFQETDEFYSVDGGPRIAGQFCGVASADGVLSFGLAQAWQRYPKAVSVRDGKTVIELLPRQPHENFNRDLPYYLVYPFCDGSYRMKWGMSFTERMRFDFSGGNDVEAALNLPVVAVLPASWYSKTCVFPGLDTPGFDKIDKKIVSSFEARLKQMHEQREYGFFNWGDSFGEKGENWTNNEYDMACGLFMTFLRTGDRRIFRHALEAARHQADVDICHAYPDPYYVGTNFGHRAGHNGGYKVWSSTFSYYQSAANGHTWSAGMVDAWHLAGDATVMDAVLLLGDHIALAMEPNFELSTLSPAPRECSWALRAVLKIYEATLDPLYFQAAKNLAMKHVKKCREFKDGVWAFRNKRLEKEHNETARSITLFASAIGLKGLCEYYNASGDETVKPFIGNIARRILRGFDPEAGCGFVYNLREDGTRINFSLVTMNPTIVPPLAEAAVILDDPELYDAASRGMAAMLLRSPGISGKFLGEYQTFLADFLAAHRKFPKKYRLDFSETGLLAKVFSGSDSKWSWRGPDPMSYRVKLLKDGKTQLVFQRWINAARSKKKEEGTSITVSDITGKVVEIRPFDSSSGRLTEKFDISGKKGDLFDVRIRDIGNGDWSLLPSSNFVHAASTKTRIKITRCGMYRFYFEVPAGKEDVSISFYGAHAGGFGYWLFDEKDRLVKKEIKWQARHAISTAPASVCRIAIPEGKTRRIFSIVLWAEYDAMLKIVNSPYVSASLAFFDK